MWGVVLLWKAHCEEQVVFAQLRENGLKCRWLGVEAEYWSFELLINGGVKEELGLLWGVKRAILRDLGIVINSLLITAVENLAWFQRKRCLVLARTLHGSHKNAVTFSMKTDFGG
ncbi:MAG: hypothetical protein ACRDCS_09760 [Tannerellaceae bacterium]